MTMKRHRLGLDYRKQLNWFSLTIASWETGGRFYSYETMEARIAHGRFLMRGQYWILLSAGEVELSFAALLGADVCLP
jgi:hypothetical protein